MQAWQHGVMATPQSATETAELVKLLPAKKQARFYRLAIWPDLFGGFSLAREYGPIGQSGRLRLDLFTELDAVKHTFANTIKRKLRGGYVPCEQRLWD
jgi:predicted DNA-binding WGR domain protein